MNLSLLTGFFPFPFGVSVHICHQVDISHTHLLDIFQHHVGMTIKRLDPCQELFVVPQRDQDLGLISDRLLENGQRTLRDFILL